MIQKKYKNQKEEIIDLLISKNISLSCIIGENGSGKTTILKDTLKNINNKNTCLYIGSEFNQKTLLKNICLYINKILKNEDKKNKILKIYLSKLSKEDKWFHKYFCNDFVEIDSQTNEFIFHYDDIEKQKISSGIFLYSILKFVSIF